jgi:hypothetical protein
VPETLRVHAGQSPPLHLAQQLAARALQRVEGEALAEVGPDQPVEPEVELALEPALRQLLRLQRAQRLQRALLERERRRAGSCSSRPGEPGAAGEPEERGHRRRSGEPPQESPAADRHVLVGLDVLQLRPEVVGVLGQAALPLDVRAVDAGHPAPEASTTSKVRVGSAWLPSSKSAIFSR